MGDCRKGNRELRCAADVCIGRLSRSKQAGDRAVPRNEFVSDRRERLSQLRCTADLSVCVVASLGNHCAYPTKYREYRSTSRGLETWRNPYTVRCQYLTRCALKDSTEHTCVIVLHLPGGSSGMPRKPRNSSVQDNHILGLNWVGAKQC